MRVLIPNFDIGGHNFHFASMLCRGAIQAGVKPILLSTVGSVNSPLFTVHFDAATRSNVEIRESLEAPSNRSTINPLAAAWHSAGALRQEIKDSRCDCVLLHNADQITVGAPLRTWLRSEVPIHALLLRGGYAYKRKGIRMRCSDALTKHAALHAPWASISHLDPLAADCLTRSGRPVGVMPEPVEDVCTATIDAARRQLGLPTDRRLLVMQGALDSRKGTIQLLRAAAIARLPNTSVVLLGELDPSMANEARTLVNALGPSKCILIDRPLAQEEFMLGFVASDWQLIPYQRHLGSSGILARAAAYNRPVIASDWGWVGEATRRYDLGICCDTTSIQELANALEFTVQYQPPARSPRREEFVAFNTQGNFLAHWFKGVRDTLGLPVDTSYVAWPKQR